MSVQQPPPEFWRAIQDIHNCLFEPALWHYCLSGRPKNHLFPSFQTMDVWLDQAIERGWMEEKRLVLVSR